MPICSRETLFTSVISILKIIAKALVLFFNTQITEVKAVSRSLILEIKLFTNPS